MSLLTPSISAKTAQMNAQKAVYELTTAMAALTTYARYARIGRSVISVLLTQIQLILLSSLLSSAFVGIITTRNKLPVRHVMLPVRSVAVQQSTNAPPAIVGTNLCQVKPPAFLAALLAS
jgi:hypothetical protein